VTTLAVNTPTMNFLITGHTLTVVTFTIAAFATDDPRAERHRV